MISENDIRDAKNLVDLHAERLTKLQEICEIESKIKKLDLNRSEWVKICSGTEENIVKKKNNKTQKHMPLSKVIFNILQENPDGLTLDDIIKNAISQSTRNSKNFSSTCRQYIYNLKKKNIICRDDQTFKYRLANNASEDIACDFSENESVEG